MENCIFCRIVDDDLPSRTVYEDDQTQAFLDANPLAPGHTLILPKIHHERLSDLPEDLARAVFETLYRVIPAAEEAVDATASTVGFNDGYAAGQEIPHVHAHIIPRFEGDGGGPIHAVAGERPRLSETELDGIADDIEVRI